MLDQLPGSEILGDGLRGLAAGGRSVPALLVLVGAPRLRRHGIRIPVSPAAGGLPEHELYDLLVAEHGDEAYRHYCSLLRRLVSLENALDVLATAEG